VIGIAVCLAGLAAEEGRRLPRGYLSAQLNEIVNGRPRHRGSVVRG
jgi:hypothetical protein